MPARVSQPLRYEKIYFNAHKAQERRRMLMVDGTLLHTFVVTVASLKTTSRDVSGMLFLFSFDDGKKRLTSEFACVCMRRGKVRGLGRGERVRGRRRRKTKSCRVKSEMA